MSSDLNTQETLALAAHILEGAFFSPLNKNDWPAYFFGQPSLLGLEEEEVFDLYIRGAVAAEVLHPELAEGRRPYAWLLATSDPRPVLAQVLASLRADRPMLFHRTLLSLPAVTHGTLDPKDFELVEDYLQEALKEDPLELAGAAAAELETVSARGFRAAGLQDDAPGPAVAEAARGLLNHPEAASIESDQELLYWLINGGGLDQIDPEIAPLAMVAAWQGFCASVLALEPDMELLARLNPQLDLSVDELALFAPPDREAGHVLSATCPICSGEARIRLGSKISEEARCEHLVFVGTSDEVHVWEVLRHFSVGEDIQALMESYYQSPADLDLFSTLSNDLFELLRGQDRLHAVPVNCATAARAFYNLRAYFAGPPGEEPTTH